jgi:hypothetical protein
MPRLSFGLVHLVDAEVLPASFGPGELGHRPSSSRLERSVALALVAGAVGFGLFELRSELTIVAYTNDSSMHAEMVRFALSQLRAGHLPIRSWFPYLGLGSPEFLHYQSLGATLTALAGLVVGANRAFAWSLYLLLATWPISVYACARLFGLDRLAAGLAAACSPFVVSLLGIGYEEIAYIFIGFGLWSQLLAMWTLPLAWGTSWQAVHTGRFRRLAPVLVATTIALHFMTGYLALGVLALWPLLASHDLGRRLGRAGGLVVGSFLLAAWVIVPLVVMKPYASTNEFLAHGPDVNSYGAPEVLRWLADGQLLDAHRLPVLTVLAGVGLISTFLRSRRDPSSRALLAAFVLSLVLFFGRPTLGPLLELLPGSKDLFLRRFLMGVQLVSIVFAGAGAAVIGRLVRLGLARLAQALGRGVPRASVFALAGVAVLTGMLAPAWSAVAASDAENATYVAAQQQADLSSGRQVAALVSAARAHGPGRIYAGLPTNWGLDFSVGAVPVFRYLAKLDVDEVGFTLRTASLMTNPEAYFDEHVPGDYWLFGVRYLILPRYMASPVPAQLLEASGGYALWTVGDIKEVGVVDTTGPPIVANRHDLGAATAPFLESAEPALRRFPTVAFEGRPAAHATLAPGKVPRTPPGSVSSESVHLAEGVASARVVLRRRAVVILKASYDPGWQAFVDGKKRPTEMVAPALVGVEVGPGRHLVRFRYVAYAGYPALLGLAGLSAAGLAATGLLDLLQRRRARREVP